MSPIELPELTTPEILLNIHLNGVRLDTKYSNISSGQIERMVRQNGLELILTQLIKKHYPNVYHNQTKLHVVISSLYHEFIDSNDYITESFIKSRVDEIINESIISESTDLMTHFRCRHKSAKLFNLTIKEYIHASGLEKARYLDFIVNPNYEAIESCIDMLLSYPYFSDVGNLDLKVYYKDPTDNDAYAFITTVLLKLIGGDAEIGIDRLISSAIIRHTFYSLIHEKKVEPLIDGLSRIFHHYDNTGHLEQWVKLSENIIRGNPEATLIKSLDGYISYLHERVCDDEDLYSKQHYEMIKQIYETIYRLYVKLTKK